MCRLFFFLVLTFNIVFSQDRYEINLSLDPYENKLNVIQTIEFLNNSGNVINHLHLLDWNNAFSAFDTPLSKQLNSQFDSSLLKPSRSSNASTFIKSLKINEKPIKYRRLKEKVDIILLENINPINTDQIVKIEIEYVINFPEYKILDYGNDQNNKFVINDYFISIPKLNYTYSNLGFDDKPNRDNKYIINIKNLKDYEIISNANISNSSKKNQYVFDNIKSLKFIISKKQIFKNLKLGEYNIFTESSSLLDLENKNKNRILSFINEKFNNPLKNYVFTKKSFDENKLYPYSQVPDFIKLFEKNFLNEINLLKLMIYENLKNSSLDYRKQYWIFTGLKYQYLNDYIEKYHSDKKLIGKFSKLPFIKKHNISNNRFNYQFSLLNRFVFSRDLHQNVLVGPDKLTRINYKLNTPYTSMFYLDYLKKFVGDEVYDKSINNVLTEKNKTISQIFQHNSNKDLDWFFSDLISEESKNDYKILRDGDSINIISINKNKYPVILRKTYNDNSFEEEFINFNYNYRLLINSKQLSKIEVNPPNNLYEKNYYNNIVYYDNNKPKTIFRFLTDIDNEYEKYIYFRPNFSYNLYDAISPGISFTNKSFIKKDFSYFINPQYSFKSEKLIGNLFINYRKTITKTKILNFLFSLDKYSYNYNLNYLRLSPTIRYLIKNKDLKSNKRLLFQLENISINKQLDNHENEKYGINSLSILNSDVNADVSKSLLFKTQVGNRFLKTSLTYSYRKFYRQFKQYNFRIFLGKFIYNNTLNNIYNFSTFSNSDYTYSTYLLGRSERDGFFSQQYYKYDAGFKSKITPSYSNDYVFSINTGITLWKWIEGYFDYGLFKNKNEKLYNGFDSGLKLNLIENYLEFYFPILNSESFILKSNNYAKNIRFTFSFNPENISNLFTRRWF